METNTQETKTTRKKVIEFLAKEFDTPPADIEKSFFKSHDTMGLTECGHRVMSRTFRFHQFSISGQLLSKHYLGLRQFRHSTHYQSSISPHKREFYGAAPHSIGVIAYRRPTTTASIDETG